MRSLAELAGGCGNDRPAMTAEAITSRPLNGELARALSINLTLSCDRKSGRGRVRKSAATPKSSATVASTLEIAASGSAFRTTNLEAQRSEERRVGIATPHMTAQSLQ